MLAVATVATVCPVRRADLPLHLFRLAWLIAPLLVGPAVEAALDDRAEPIRIGVAIAAWAIWAATLIAAMVPRTETLTLMRIVVPAAFAGSIIAVILGDTSATATTIAGLVGGALPLLAFRAPVLDLFVDGSSYGDERRFLLGTPGALLVGPLLIVWAVVVAGALAGPLLFLAERWVLGVIAVVIGFPAAWFGVQALHRLSQRWLVFVPAGVVVHDKTALREPQLFRAADIAAFGPAPADTELQDLSLGSVGLALRAQLREPSAIIVNDRSAETVEPTPIAGFVVSPNRPGAVVAEAAERGFPIA